MIDATCELRGLTVGDGPYVWTSEPVGLLSTPPMRTDDVDRPLRGGAVPGRDHYGTKSMQFEVAVLGSSAAECEQLAADLAAAWARSDDELELTVRVTGTPAEYAFVGKPRGAEISLGRPNELFGGHVAHALLRFTATDPTRYSAVAESIVIGLADAGTGLIAPLVAPLSAGAGGTGLGNATNAGGVAVRRWTATLHGPLTNPRLTHVDSGRFVQVNTTIANGQTVVLDGQHAAILLGGSTPRPSWRGPGTSWFELASGVNGLRLTAAAGSGNCVFVWRSGW